MKSPRKQNPDPVVTMNDCKALGFCASGVRRWMNDHGLDMRTFLKEGYPASVIEMQKDAYGNRLAQYVRAREDGE